MNQARLLMLILCLAGMGKAHAAVVALTLAPQYQPGSRAAAYDLDQDGSAEFTLGSISYQTLDYPSSAYVTYHGFERRAGFEMSVQASPGSGILKLAALDGADVIGFLSEWSSAGTPLHIVSGGSNLTGQFGYQDDFTNLRSAFLGYRLTKDGLDYHGLIQIELYRGELVALEPVEVLDGLFLSPLYGFPNVRVVGSWIETEAGRSIAVSSVPEPGRMLLMAGAVGAMINRRRRAALGAG